jgi:hypothetical protein
MELQFGTDVHLEFAKNMFKKLNTLNRRKRSKTKLKHGLPISRNVLLSYL